jgi:hypothetical protein
MLKGKYHIFLNLAHVDVITKLTCSAHNWPSSRTASD